MDELNPYPTSLSLLQPHTPLEWHRQHTQWQAVHT
jgi:hypothetical protein